MHDYTNSLHPLFTFEWILILHKIQTTIIVLSLSFCNLFLRVSVTPIFFHTLPLYAYSLSDLKSDLFFLLQSHFHSPYISHRILFCSTTKCLLHNLAQQSSFITNFFIKLALIPNDVEKGRQNTHIWRKLNSLLVPRIL